jgi:hypothetical protein
MLHRTSHYIQQKSYLLNNLSENKDYWSKKLEAVNETAKMAQNWKIEKKTNLFWMYDLNVTYIYVGNICTRFSG